MVCRTLGEIAPGSRLFVGVPFLGVVNVVCGPHEIDVRLAGFSVEEIQFSLRDMLNVDMAADAYIGGRLASPSYRLRQGDRVEFMKEWGRKGIGKTYTKQEFMQAFHMTEADWSDWSAKGLPLDTMKDGTIVLNETEVDWWKGTQRGHKSENHAVLDRLADAAEEIAHHLDPTPPEIVKSRYIAQKLGCSVKWVGDMARTGLIPKNCIVDGTGDGKQWRFFRPKIDKWIEGKN